MTGIAFFHNASHQVYGTELNHSQIGALEIQHVINYPEYFIESNTEQSLLHYLQNVSSEATWSDKIFILAVSHALIMKINAIETAANFSDITLVHPHLYWGS